MNSKKEQGLYQLLIDPIKFEGAKHLKEQSGKKYDNDLQQISFV